MDGADQHFIRRFSKRTAVQKDRVVLPAAFEARSGESALSFTLRSKSLQEKEALLKYQRHFVLSSGDLPGLCFLTRANLTNDLQPPLPPRFKAAEDDQVYGKLHHETDVPNETQRNQMAVQATQNGLLLPAILKGREHPPKIESDSQPVISSSTAFHKLQSTIDNRKSTILLAWFVAFASAALLYVATANRWAQWQDSGYHILRVVTHETVNPLGLALSHPLHHWLARFAVWLGFTEPCHAVTLVSSIAAAIAVANIFGCVITLTGSRLAGVFAAASFALAHTVWQLATLAETYTLAAALLSAECWCLLVFLRSHRTAYLCGALLFNGLGVSNHLLAGLTTPVLAAVLIWAPARRVIRTRDAIAASALWLIGIAPYVSMVVAEWLRTADAAGTLRSALFGQGYADEVLSTSLSPRTLLIALAFIVLNFPNLLLPIAFYGLARPMKEAPPVTRRALLAGLIIHAVFVLRYPIVDQHTFFVPLYVFVAIFAGVGFARILRALTPPRRRTVVGIAWALLALTPLWYAALPSVARRMNVLASVERHRPYRDDYVYLFTPWSVAERSAERMSRHAVQLGGDHGLIIVEDRMAEFAVRYRALRDAATGVRIVSSLADPGFPPTGRPVVFVPAHVDHPPAPAPPLTAWKRVGDLYLLEPAPPPGP